MKKLSFSLILGIAFVIFVIDSVRPKTLGFVRQTITVAIMPAVESMSLPIHKFNEWVVYINSINDVCLENKKLLAKNIVLKKYKDDFQALKHENSELRSLLNYGKKFEKRFSIARIISDTGGMYARTLLLNSGSVDGVEDGQGIMTNKGLLGRTVHTNYNNSRVLLLTDINSQVPIFIDKIKEHGILAGNVNDYPVLKFLRDPNKVKVGQKIVTSGHGGVFPPGVEIGEIVSNHNGIIKVSLYANPNDSSYVSIIAFEPTDLINKRLE